MFSPTAGEHRGHCAVC